MAMGRDPADQRFYASQFGRFMSADRFRQTPKANDSGIWNKYSYTGGDPVNWIDVTGQMRCNPASPDCQPPGASGGPGGGGPPSGPKTPCTEDRPGVRPDCVGGDGGGGGGQSTFQTTLSKAIADAVADLSQPQCQNLYGNASTRANGFNPATLIQQIFGNGDGTTKVGNTTISTTFANIGIQGLTILTPLGNVKVLINSSSFSSGDVWDSTITLLHELGHIYNDLSGSGGSTITKLGDVTGSNDPKIVSNCLQDKPGND